MKLTTTNLIDALSRSDRQDLSRKVFGVCPLCPKDELPGDRLDYPVLHVDTFSYAVCNEHQVRWCLGYLQLGAHAMLPVDKHISRPNPEWPSALAVYRKNAEKLLNYKDVTQDVCMQQFIEPKQMKHVEADVQKLEKFWDTVRYGDLLGDYGLEARAKGIVDYLDLDFMTECNRDKATGKLVKITWHEDEDGEYTSKREIVD